MCPKYVVSEAAYPLNLAEENQSLEISASHPLFGTTLGTVWEYPLGKIRPDQIAPS
jgi:hypothetical protein